MGRFDFSLSNSKLSMLRGDDGCPACFYDHCRLKVERPRGIFPSLPSGMDDRMKRYFDHYRPELPPAVKGLLPGTLCGDEASIKKVRHWRSNASVTIPTPDGTVGLIGAYDDILQRTDGFLSIIDYKTRGSVPDAGYAERYSQTQADLYHVQMKLAGMNPHPETFFVFVTPQECDVEYALPDCLPIRFDVTVQMVIAHYDDGMDLIHEGAKILAGTRPVPAERCPWCQWIKAKHELAKAADVAA